MNTPLYQAYKNLYATWGPQHWWPAESQLEIIVGAILTQNTSWKQVERAIKTLKANHAIDLYMLSETPHSILASWIKPSGYYNQKAKHLQKIATLILKEYNGSIELLFEQPSTVLRNNLLAWPGVGPETADSILLYGAKRAEFVVDAYTRRFMTRHGWCNGNESYEQLKQVISHQLPSSIEVYQEFHALIVKLGQQHCRTKPDCSSCPLNSMLTRPIFP